VAIGWQFLEKPREMLGKQPLLPVTETALRYPT
jgi:hypothetical protein